MDILDREYADLRAKIVENRSKWRKLRIKYRLNAMRHSDLVKIWSPGEPPMTFKQHEARLRKLRRIALAKELRQPGFGIAPLPRDRANKP